MSAKYIEPDFSALAVSIASAALLNMKPGKDMRLARYNIDLLSLLKEKTKGHLSPEESHLLSRSIADLQLEFVRSESAQKAPGASPSERQSGKGEAAPPAPAKAESGANNKGSPA